MDCKVAPRIQTYSIGDMFRHIHHVQDRTPHRNGVRDFKWKWWHDSDDKRDQDAKGKSAAKQDAEVDGDESPAKKSKKDKENKKDTKTAPNLKKPEKD